MVAGCSRLVLKPAFAALDGHGPTLTVGDKSYHQVDVTVGDAMALFGCGANFLSHCYCAIIFIGFYSSRKIRLFWRNFTLPSQIFPDLALVAAAICLS